jgi:Leucine-rich repeat (LRR) protein
MPERYADDKKSRGLILAGIAKSLSKSINELTENDFRSVEKLVIDYDLDNFSFPSELPNLKILFIPYANVLDLEPLSLCPNLTYLCLHDGFVEDIRQLSFLHLLEGLDLSSAEWIKDFEPLSGLTKLKKLDLAHTGFDDIRQIENLSLLEELDLEGNEIIDFGPIRNLVNLRKLSIYNTYIDNLNPLRDLKYLDNLQAGNTNIESVEPLSDLCQLRSLDISRCALEDIAPLSTLIKLEFIDISLTGVEEIEPLINLVNLKVLSLHSCFVSEYRPLYKLDNLKVLFIDSEELNTEQIAELHDARPDMHITDSYFNFLEAQLLLSDADLPVHTLKILSPGIYRAGIEETMPDF